MRRVVIVVPDWLSPEGGESVLRQSLSTLQPMAELGTLFKLPRLPVVETPEAIWLGFPPDAVKLRQGPLTVSALGADPPERSTHFHLSILSFEDGVARLLKVRLPDEQVREIAGQAARLDTKTLTFIAGEGVDHGLVWESLGDLGTTDAAALDGKPIKDYLPEGDAERALRQYIDDSLNLLSALPFNEQRLDEGLPPANLFWPWGHGVRTPVPNLALRRGEPALVLSNSMRLAGLARLAGYRHGDRSAFGQGTGTRLAWLADESLHSDATIIVIDALQRLRSRQKLEEAEWLTRELDRELLAPLFQTALTTPTRLTILAPSSGGPGLAVTFETKNSNSSILPFDERALEERTLPSQDTWIGVERGLSPLPQMGSSSREGVGSGR